MQMAIKAGEMECSSVGMRDIFSETAGHDVNIHSHLHTCNYVAFNSSDP